jgi:hypothetical protein
MPLGGALEDEGVTRLALGEVARRWLLGIHAAGLGLAGVGSAWLAWHDEDTWWSAVPALLVGAGATWATWAHHRVVFVVAFLGAVGWYVLVAARLAWAASQGDLWLLVPAGLVALILAPAALTHAVTVHDRGLAGRS